ncbi:MAG: hypothetical protein ACRD6W_09815 [Nitrososphaerales archaeon]
MTTCERPLPAQEVDRPEGPAASYAALFGVTQLDKSLLKHEIVIEVGPEGTDIYYSRKVKEDVDKLVAITEVDASEGHEYCHGCFHVPCTCNPTIKDVPPEEFKGAIIWHGAGQT